MSTGISRSRPAPLDHGKPRGAGPRWVPARHRKPLVIGGHERSQLGYENRRSHSNHRCDLGRPSRLGTGSNPTSSASTLGQRLDLVGVEELHLGALHFGELHAGGEAAVEPTALGRRGEHRTY
jgi:hypothetical protein